MMPCRFTIPEFVSGTTYFIQKIPKYKIKTLLKGLASLPVTLYEISRVVKYYLVLHLVKCIYMQNKKFSALVSYLN